MSSSGTSRSTTPSVNKNSRGNPAGFLFIDDTRKDDAQQNQDVAAQKKSIRAQAAKASSQARLETIRKRAEGRSRTQKPGQGVFALQLGLNDQAQQWTEPLPKVAVKKHESVVKRSQERDVSIAVHADSFLGGSIPAAQAEVAILSQFLSRFTISGGSSDRPWPELVLGHASSGTPYASMPMMALQANARALAANDLQRTDMQRHATTLYLSTISQLKSALNSPRWNDSVVMHTTMIVTLFEAIQSKDPKASHPHVRGVGSLIQQRGPRKFVSGLEHRTFRYYRVNLFLMSLADRQPCFLAEPDWKNIPFSGDVPPKTTLDALIDILVEVPGVLAAIEALSTGGLTPYALIQKGLELAYWVRRLIYDLEKWKEDYIWTHPAVETTPYLRSTKIQELCILATATDPYDQRLGEALNCYLAAHLILTRIAQRMAERSLIVRTALSPPHSISELVVAIVLISEKHIGDPQTDMVSMMVTGFPLKVAESTFTELDDKVSSTAVQALLVQINREFAKRYNINWSVPKENNYQV